MKEQETDDEHLETKMLTTISVRDVPSPRNKCDSFFLVRCKGKRVKKQVHHNRHSELK